MSACRSCGADVRWAVIAAGGKRMPVDAEPSDDGKVIFVGDGRVRVLAAGEAHDGERFASHFATCPNATEWRRPR